MIYSMPINFYDSVKEILVLFGLIAEEITDEMCEPIVRNCGPNTTATTVRVRGELAPNPLTVCLEAIQEFSKTEALAIIIMTLFKYIDTICTIHTQLFPTDFVNYITNIRLSISSMLTNEHAYTTYAKQLFYYFVNVCECVNNNYRVTNHQLLGNIEIVTNYSPMQPLSHSFQRVEVRRNAVLDINNDRPYTDEVFEWISTHAVLDD